MRGGVVSFASLRVVSSRSLVSLASLLFACAWSRGCWFACLLRLRDLRYLWYLRDPWYLRMFACLHVCMFAVVSWVACLRVGIFGIFAHACLQ